MDKKIYSDFEVTKATVKFDKDNESSGNIISNYMGQTGSLEESMDARTITKKNEGIEETVVVKGTGTGELKFTGHVRWGVYQRFFGMKMEKLKEGVYAYGKSSVHERFTLTCLVMDEYGRISYRAYPSCIITDGIARKVENGSDEVAEIELTIKVAPDDNGMGMYQAQEEELKDDTIKTNWVDKFNVEDLFENVA